MAGLKTERIPIMFDRELVERIDDYSFAARIRTRSEAVRHLIREGLEKVTENEKGEATA